MFLSVWALLLTCDAPALSVCAQQDEVKSPCSCFSWIYTLVFNPPIFPNLQLSLASFPCPPFYAHFPMPTFLCPPFLLVYLLVYAARLLHISATNLHNLRVFVELCFFNNCDRSFWVVCGKKVLSGC